MQLFHRGGATQKRRARYDSSRRCKMYVSQPKQVPATTPVSAGVWNTVGSSGKATAVPAPAARAPAAAAAVSVPKPNGASAIKVPTTPKPAAAARIDDTPPPPSNDFVKWLGDSLKGLNSSVNGTRLPDPLFHSLKLIFDRLQWKKYSQCCCRSPWTRIHPQSSSLQR